jgi:CheY-like chemotaxis protein
MARGNQSQLHRLLTNLLGNARKFTPRGGRVDVSLCHAPQEQRADLQARQQRAREDAQRKDHAFAQTPLGGWVHLRVEDTGCGIAPENLPRIFERYFTVTHKHNRGSGLGLNICQSIAHHHGGFIEVQSQLGAGTSFDVWLPIAQEEEVHTPRSLIGPPLVLPSATLYPRHRVVALDDDYDTRDLLQVVLTSANMEVETLSDERGLVASLAAPTSILLVDFTLPRTRGDELIARLRANPAYTDLPIVVLSARDDAATRAACVAAGAADFISKPFEVSNLIARIRQHSRLLSQPQPGSTVAGG